MLLGLKELSFFFPVSYHPCYNCYNLNFPTLSLCSITWHTSTVWFCCSIAPIAPPVFSSCSFCCLLGSDFCEVEMLNLLSPYSCFCSILPVGLLKPRAISTCSLPSCSLCQTRSWHFLKGFVDGEGWTSSIISGRYLP